MIRIDRVLFPTDFSSRAAEAYPTALQFATQFGAELHLLHAIHLHVYERFQAGLGSISEDEVYSALEEDARYRLERLARRTPVPARLSYRRHDAPANAILDYAEEWEIDIVVMATHGHRGFRKWLLGGVAEEVVRRARCPVLTVRHREDSRSPLALQRILVPTDFSSHAEAALAHARELALLTGARIQMLHVIQAPLYPVFYGTITAPPPHATPGELDSVARERLEDLLEGDEELEQVKLVRRGVPTEGIVRAASEEGSDLIVMSSHGLTGLSHILLGSVTTRVLQRADCPVLIVKNFGRQLIERPAA